MSDLDLDAVEADEIVDEQHRVARLLRWISGFLVFPAFSLSFAFIFFDDPSEHWGHIAVLMAFGIPGLFAGLLARRIAVKYVV